MTVKRLFWVVLGAAVLVALSPVAAIITFGVVCYIAGGKRKGGRR